MCLRAWEVIALLHKTHVQDCKRNVISRPQGSSSVTLKYRYTIYMAKHMDTPILYVLVQSYFLFCKTGLGKNQPIGVFGILRQGNTFISVK